MKFLKTLTILGMALVFAGCATPAPKGPTPPPQKFCSDGRPLPTWTVMGGMAFPGDAGKSFYGTGVASNISNPALLREAADNRAIADLAKQFEVYTASLMNDYMASTSAGSKASEEQNVETIKKTVVKQTLNGVAIADRCQESQSGVFYSLARLDMERFKNAIEKKAELSEQVKKFVKDNAEKMAEKLAAEEAKH